MLVALKGKTSPHGDVLPRRVPERDPVVLGRGAFLRREADAAARLESEERVFFMDVSLATKLVEGKQQTFSVVERSHSLVFTKQLLSKLRVGIAQFSVPKTVEDMMSDGGYEEIDGCL